MLFPLRMGMWISSLMVVSEILSSSLSSSSSSSSSIGLPPSKHGDAGTVHPEMDMELTPAQSRALFYRNIILLMLSFCVGGKTLYAIISARHQNRHFPLRRFANILMAILLGLELIQSIYWAVGVSLAGAVDGSAPFGPINAAKADRLCFPISVTVYYLDLIIYSWHAVIAYSVWLWVVRHKDAGYLRKRLLDLFLIATIGCAFLTLIPILERDLGLWPHSDCFVRHAWSDQHHPTLAIMVSRMILLPLCLVTVIILNAWTVRYLRNEARRYASLIHSSVFQLQARLILVTIIFALTWILMSIPLYLNVRTFALEFGVKWAFAILFLDSLAYGYPHSVRCLCPLLPRWSSRSSLARDRNSLIYSTTGASIEEDDAIPTTEAEMSHTWIDASSRPHGSSIPLRMGRIRDEPTTDSSSFTACRLFVTTFDMNKCYLPQQGDCDYQEERQRPEGVSSPSSSYHRNPLSEGLEAWIPSVGYHVYAIAVQRCRLGQLARLRAAIHEHLGGSSKYILCASVEVAGAFQGKLALLLFARIVDVESKAFHLLSSTQRAIGYHGCKGIAVTAFQYYDTSIALINAHLPSPAAYGGDVPLNEKDKHLVALLQSLRLETDHDLFDSHLQYHHVVFMGNLNYRLLADATTILTQISLSSQPCQERLERTRQRGMHWSWREVGYGRLWSTTSDDACSYAEEDFSPCEEQEYVGSSDTGFSHDFVTRCWDWVRHVDTLTHRRNEGFILYGFHECKIGFPPSFKWHHGASADDYTELSVVKRAYVISRESQEEQEWTPSYTDRILTSSLPGMANRLVASSYDMCSTGPLAKSSDHRPISEAVTIQVDTSRPPLGWASLFDSSRSVSSGSSSSSLTSSYEGSTAWAMAAAANYCQQLLAGGVRTPPRTLSNKPIPVIVIITMSDFILDINGVKPSMKERKKFGEKREEKDGVKAEDDDEGERSGLSDESEDLDALKGECMPLGRSISAIFEGHEAEDDDHEDIEKLPGAEAASYPSHLGGLQISATPSSFVSSTGGVRGELDDRLEAAATFVPTRHSKHKQRQSTGRPQKRTSFYARHHAKEGSRHKTEASVKEVQVVYPLPCEDPLLNLRRTQAMELCFNMYSGGQTTTAAGGGSGSGSAGQEKESRHLQNLHREEWRPELEYKAETTGGDDEEEEEDGESKRTHHSVLPSLLSAAAGRGGGRGDLKKTKKEVMQVKVTTLWPFPPLHHALIKFMGGQSGRRELGQGVMDLTSAVLEGNKKLVAKLKEEQSDEDEEDDEENEEEGQSARSRTGATRRRRRVSVVGSHRREEKKSRQEVELSLGSQYQGKVSFAVDVKVVEKKEKGKGGGGGQGSSNRSSMMVAEGKDDD